MMVHWDKVMRSRREDEKGRAQIQTVVLISEDSSGYQPGCCCYNPLLQPAVT